MQTFLSMQYDTTFSSTHQSALIACTRKAFTFRPARVFPFLISSFSREISTELLIQHMFTVFSDLIGPKRRLVPSSIFSPFAAFPIFRARDPRGVPISCDRNFSVSFDRRGTSVFLDFNAALSDRYK